MNLKSFFGVLFCLALVGLHSVVFAATYYVANSGNDSNPGTMTDPWRTIAKANQTSQPGDLVYIRKGSYSDAIRPSRSGLSESDRIVYRAYPGELVYLTDSTPINLGSKAYVTVDGFIMDKSPNLFTRFAEISNAHHITIQNCYMKNNSRWGAIRAANVTGNDGDEWDGGETHHCIIRNNTIINGEGDTIQFDTNCHYNLIENNYIDGANGHGGLVIQGRGPSCDYNVIRSNTFKDTRGTAHAYVMLGVYINHTVIEGNVFDGSPGGDEYAMKLRGEHNIVRHNTVYNSPGYGVHIYAASAWGTHPYSATRHRVYSNTIHNSMNKLGWEDATLSQVIYTGGLGCDYNYYQNNILNIFNYGIYLDKEGDAPLGTHNLYTNNIIRKGSGGVVVRYLQSAVTLAEAQSRWPEIFSDNVDADPLFVDVSQQDFNLRPGSPCIDGGTHLTYAISEGSGTTIIVDDAFYFTDGFGIVDGDLIQVGSNSPVMITDIDYGNNIITVGKSISWNRGDGVSLPYNGSAPDIGAFEYGDANSLYVQAEASPTMGEAPLTVAFTGGATGGTPPHTYSWDFGDGESANAQNPTYVYKKAGTYVVTLSVTDSGLSRDTDSLEISVSIETIPPTGTISINQGALTTNSTSVTLELSATDEQSGMGEGAEMQLSNDNITWSNPEPYTSSRDWLLTDGDGVKTVYVKYKDAAGNWIPNAVSDDIILKALSPSSLVHCTFEQGDDGWGGAIRETAYMRNDSVSYAGQYSMDVLATGTPSYLTIDIKPAGWELERYPHVEFAYKIPNGVPIGLFFQTDDGWICLGGTNTHNHGSYTANDAQVLIDDDAWHVISINVRDAIREVYPTANSVSEFEWFTFGAQQGNRFWFDEFVISAGVSDGTTPTAAITLDPVSPLKAGTVIVTLTTSENVISVPTPLTALESDSSTTIVELTGPVPGNTFSGTCLVDSSVAEGVVTFALAEDALADEAGNKGNEITSGKTALIDRTAPTAPDRLLISE